MRRSLAFAMLVAAVSVATSTRAQAPSEADRLFNRARALMEGNHFAEACPLLAESEKLAPAAGTALNLGLCYEKLGKTLSAYNAYFDAAALAEKTDPKRAGFARERVTALEARLVRLAISIDGSDADAATVKRDKDVLDKTAFGQAQPVDPGEHVVEVTARGKRAWRTTIHVVGEGVEVGVRVPALEDASAPFVPTAPEATRGGLAPTQWVGVGLGALGLAALTAGTVLAFGAKSRHDQASSHCPGDVCDAQGTALDREAVERGNVATVFFVSGLLAVGGGVALFLTGRATHAKPATASPAPSMAIGPTGFVVRGAF